MGFTDIFKKIGKEIYDGQKKVLRSAQKEAEKIVKAGYKEQKVIVKKAQDDAKKVAAKTLKNSIEAIFDLLVETLLGSSKFYVRLAGRALSIFKPRLIEELLKVI